MRKTVSWKIGPAIKRINAVRVNNMKRLGNCTENSKVIDPKI